MAALVYNVISYRLLANAVGVRIGVRVSNAMVFVLVLGSHDWTCVRNLNCCRSSTTGATHVPSYSHRSVRYGPQ